MILKTFCLAHLLRGEVEMWKWWPAENIPTNLCFLSICFNQPACHKLFSRKICGIYRKDICQRQNLKCYSTLQDSHQASQRKTNKSASYVTLYICLILRCSSSSRTFLWGSPTCFGTKTVFVCETYLGMFRHCKLLFCFSVFSVSSRSRIDGSQLVMVEKSFWCDFPRFWGVLCFEKCFRNSV